MLCHGMCMKRRYRSGYSCIPPQGYRGAGFSCFCCAEQLRVAGLQLLQGYSSLCLPLYNRNSGIPEVDCNIHLDFVSWGSNSALVTCMATAYYPKNHLTGLIIGSFEQFKYLSYPQFEYFRHAVQQRKKMNRCISQKMYVYKRTQVPVLTSIKILNLNSLNPISNISL